MSDPISGRTRQSEEAEVLPPHVALGFLLKGIEEASKHSRSILFALTTTTAFVLIAALSGEADQSVALPILGNEIPRRQFFVVTPVLILLIYAYLHVYVRELQGRYIRLDSFQERWAVSADVRRDYLFPWLLILAFEARKERAVQRGVAESLAANDQLGRREQGGAPRSSYFLLLAILAVWLQGPIVLAFLLGTFLRDQNAVAIFPCTALIAASWIAITGLRPRRSRLESAAWLSGLIVVLLMTLASVPELRERTYLAALWDARSAVGVYLAEELLPVVGIALAIIAPVAATLMLVRAFLLRLIQVRYLRRRMRRILARDSTGDGREKYHVAVRGSLENEPESLFPAQEILSRARTALIVGDAGSGKTTLLRQLGVLLTSDPQFESEHTVPVFVRLSRIVDEGRGIFHSIEKTLEEHRLEPSSGLVTRLARSGQLTVLLDGLDELTVDERNGIGRLVQGFVQGFPECRVYLTSRPLSSFGDIEAALAHRLRLAPLSSTEAAEVIRSRLGDSAEGNTPADLMTGLPNEITQSPLLLAYAMDLFKQMGALPDTKEDLINLAVKMRLADWDTARGLSNRFSFDQKAHFLARLAHWMNGGTTAVSKADALVRAKTWFSMEGAEDFEGLLEELLRSGLIVESQSGEIAFVHRAVQEHFQRQGSTGRES